MRKICFLDLKSTNEQTKFNDGRGDNDKKYISQVQPLVHRYPIYEVSITPKTAFSAEFYCRFWNGYKNLYFNHVPVTVTANTSTLPQITLTSNENTVHLNHPFTVTCTISNFETAGKKYLVNYFNNRNGLLAGYEVDGKKTFTFKCKLNRILHRIRQSSPFCWRV